MTNVKMTHIEVADAKNRPGFENGQLLEVIRQTPAFIWVRGFDGVAYQVSKKTKRINGTSSSFIRTSRQPLMNF
jgi:hypothetical protein